VPGLAVFTLCVLSKLPSRTFEILDSEFAKMKNICNKLKYYIAASDVTIIIIIIIIIEINKYVFLCQ